MKLKKQLQALVKKYCFSELIQDSFDFTHPFGIPDLPKLYVRSFGERNPDKIFYMIWRDRLGSGFFSNFTQVISHMMLAEQHGWIPVVDYLNFRTIYNEPEPVNGTRNAWEYYFRQISPYTLDEVYSSRNVLFAEGNTYPSLFCRNNREYREFLDKKIQLQDWIVDEFLKYKKLLDDSFVLGIHFRGKEMNTTVGHPFAPTVKQMLAQTDFILKQYPVNKIFFSSEEKDYLDLFVKRYGDKLIYLPAFRVSKINAYNINPRPFHRYLLGKEALLDSLMLGSCDILLCGRSGITYNAVRSSRRLRKVYTIHNGFNSKNILIAKYLYRLKRCLPQKLGGLKDKVVISEYPKMEDFLYELK